MKKNIILIPLLGLLLYVCFSSNKYGYGATSGAPLVNGAVGSGGCSCHSSSTSISVSVQLLNGTTPVTTYVPGATYKLKITGTNGSSSTLPYFGFQACIVKASGAGSSSAVGVGTLGTPPSTNTHVFTAGSGSGIQVFEHFSSTFGDGAINSGAGGGSGTVYVDSINWTAPVAGTGNVVLYGILNAVNHDGGSGGDLYNAASPVTIFEQVAPITGTTSVCLGGTTILSDLTSGGTWSTTAGTGSVSLAASGTTVTVTGVAAGTATINYNAGSSGTASTTVTVIAAPSPITGTFTVCTGSTTALSDATTGGTWSTTAGTGSVTLSPSGSTVTVTGVTAGTAQVSYTASTTGCSVAATVTVNATPTPGTISGPSSFCIGTPGILTGSPSGGTWVANTAGGFATIGATTGIVSGTSVGLVSISYGITSSGCTSFGTRIVTVNAAAASISGTPTMCQGTTTILTDASAGGTWSTVAGTGSVSLAASGTTVTVTGVSAGTATVNYTLATGCAASIVVTVNPLPAAITGPTNVCVGASTTLSESTSGGVWSSSNSSIASVGSLTGNVNGVAVGTATISYTLTGTGCFITQAVAVDPLPTAITGPSTVCVGAVVAESSTPSGGTWTSSLSSIGSVDVVGNVTGVSAGTITINYALSTGCQATKQITVNTSPAAITGSLNLCVGSTSTLSNTTTGGTWSSTTTSVATIGSTSGFVNALTIGTSLISYTLASSGCAATATVSVNTLPSAGTVTGASSICVGTNTTLSNATTGGRWSSTNTSIATIGSTSGTMTGVAAGTDTIIYTITTGPGCTNSVSFPVTINPNPTSLTGSATVCVGASTTLASTPSGGTWTSGTPAAGTINSLGSVTGIAAGVTNITYALSTGCKTVRQQTINAIPAAISGPSQVCVNSTITQTDVTTGGTWSSSAPALGSINAGGVVTGVSAGIPVITYTLPSTGCFNTKPITVNPLPAASAGSSVAICTGGSTTLGASGGGTYSWTPGTGLSCSTCASPVATPVTTTTYTVTVTLPTGCLAKSSVTVSVNPLPAAIAGLSAVCEGASINLTDATAGGTWSSGATGTATVVSSGTTGTVTGVAAGVATITYALGTGCLVTKNVSVNAAPTAISGASSVCVGLTTTLTDGVSGGTWTSSNTARATVGSSTGVVTGVGAGSVNITYTVAGGCFVTTTLTVNPLSPITGLSSLCAGSSTTLSNATSGGTWSSSNTAVGTISTGGVFSALAPGNTTISYSLPTGCTATLTVTVISAPAPISGSNRVCLGFTTTLSDPGGGAWSSSTPSIASVGSASGVVTGVSLGVATITYSLGTSCIATMPITVSPNPVAIVGASVVCEASTIALTDATSGGTWSSSNANASVGSTGVVTGVAGGPSVISYTLSTGCFAVRGITVNPLPAVIGGTTSLCQGSTSTLTDATTGGTWSSSNTAVGTISTAGIFNALTAGTTTISYAAGGCTRTTVVTVNPLPASITGVTNVCVGNTTTLSDATGGGTWSCTPTTTATIGSTSGIVTGVATGVASVVYTLPTGCSKTTSVTVNALPVVAPIAGSSTVCTGVTTALTDATPGGVWNSSATGIATISTSGVLSGIAPGTANITYTVTGTGGCATFVTFPVTVNGSPSPVTGTLTVCVGSSTTLSDATGGGTWTSAVTGVATIGSVSGVVNGVAAGTSAVTYTIGNGCTATAVVTVNPLPTAIAGPSTFCVGATITLTDAGGGTWASSDLSLAIIGTTSGVVTGVAAGTVSITYTLPTGCAAVTTVTVNPLANAGTISGPTSVCAGSTITLTDGAPGGVWSSSSANATVGSTGVVTGVTAGTATISYTVTNSCGPVSATYAVTINPAPDAGSISGSTSVCVGSGITLADAASGGTWSSATPSVATVGSASGTVTGVAVGTATISYTVTNICGTIAATYNVTVAGPPSAGTITGTDSVCQGDTVRLHDLVTGGTWSSALGNATVDATGLVTGVTGGIDTIKYTVTNSCGSGTATLIMHIRLHSVCNVGVDPVPASVAGISVYPNPSNGTFTVEIPELRGEAAIVVSDVLGKVVEQRIVKTAGKTVLELRNAAIGTYLVKVNMGGGSFRQKIVIW